MRLRKLNLKGMSLLEVIFAMALVTIAVVGIAQLMVIFRTSDSSLGASSCNDIAKSSLDRIAGLTYRPATMNYLITTTDNVGSPTSTCAPTETCGIITPGVPNDLRWPGTAPYVILDPAQNPPVLRSANLIMGSINALQALYNSNINYCSQSGGVALSGVDSKSLMLNTTGEAMTSAITTSLRIQPYMIDSNVVLGDSNDCPAQLFLRPASRVPNPPSLGVDFQFDQDSVIAHSDMGFLATVYVKYNDNKGNAQTCSASRPFFYVRDDQDPALPDLLSAVLTPPLSGNACDFTPQTATVTIGYSASAMEQGTVLTCGDYSTIRGNPFTNPDPSTTCDSNGANVPAYKPYANPPVWGPCDTVKQCGVSPDPALSSATMGPNGPVYTLVYTGLPYSCAGDIIVNAIDVAGNNTAGGAPVAFYISWNPCNTCSNPNATYCAPFVCPAPIPPSGGGK